MRISAINPQQNYNHPTSFKGGKASKKGCIIGSFAGLAMTGAMMATCPVDWQKIKTWPIMGIALTTAGAYNGKRIGDIFDKKNDKNDNIEI